MTRHMRVCYSIAVFVFVAFLAGASAQPTHTMAAGRPSHVLRKSVASSETAAAPRGLSSLPAAAQGPISAALGRDDSRYWSHATARGFHAENPQHALAADFTSEGVEVRSKTARWSFGLRGYGYGESLLAVSHSAPRSKTNRVEFQRKMLTEWYINGPVGLEQGFTLSQPPGQAHGRPLTFALALSGDLTPRLEAGGRALTLTQRDGQAALRYTGLVAYDATGRELRGSLALHGDELLLQVDDAGARYPVVVDPLVEQAKLTASDGAVQDRLGYTVAIDGNTLVAGAPGNNSIQGAVYVFVQPGTSWATATETAKLTASDGAHNDSLGSSVAIAGDTVVAGAPGAVEGGLAVAGAAYVFVKPAAGWTTATETAKLTASHVAVFGAVGSSVAISGDTIVSGGGEAAYVFVKPATGWAGGAPTPTTETARLTNSDQGDVDGFGSSVGVSGDTVVVGSYSATVNTNVNQGAAYVFVEPGSGWATGTETAKLIASDGATNVYLGSSAAIDGDTVVVGAPQAIVGDDVGNAGAVYVFVQPGTGWAGGAATPTTETAKLWASDGKANDGFGTAVAIQGGNLVVGDGVATPEVGPTPAGAAYVFTEPTSGWATTSTFAAKLTTSDDGGEQSLGNSVSISGNTVAVGAPGAMIGSNPIQGAAYVFGPATPVIVWPTPAPITYGTPVSTTQQNATSFVPGTFSYLPPLGTVLAGGQQTLFVTFTPTDPSGYTTATDTVYLTVLPAPSSTSITSNSPNPSLAGQTVTVSFQVTGVTVPFGSVTVTASTGETCSAPLGIETGSCGITFVTTGTRTLTAVYPANSNFSSSSSAPVSQSVTGPVASVSPTSYNFGTVYAGALTTKGFTVSNTGTTAMTITGPILSIVRGGNSNEFVEVNLCPRSLAAGKSCTVTVTFVPGPYYTAQTATLSIMDNAAGSPQTAMLTALVINPQASLSATSLSFGAQTVNLSATKTVTLKNTGTTALTPISLAVTGTNASDFTPSSNCGSSLAAGNSCTISVAFKPAAKGSRSATLKVTDNAQSGTQTVLLSGTGK